MNITYVEVSYGLTYSANFQGCRVDVRLGAQVQPGQDWETVESNLQNLAKQKCEASVLLYQEGAK